MSTYTLVTVKKHRKPNERLRGAHCCAVALRRGDCSMTRTAGSYYCYYHAKLACGMLDPVAPESYPVLPLPTFGYTVRLTLRGEAP